MLHEGINSVGQIEVDAQHVIVLAHAEDFVIGKLLVSDSVRVHELQEHLQQGHVEALQLVAREAARPDADVNLVGRGSPFGRRIGIVLNGGDGLLNQRHVERALRVAILRGHVAILTGLRLWIVAEFVLVAAVEPFQIGQLLKVFARLAHLIHDGQMDGVATTAHPRTLEIGIKFWFYAQRIIHRIGDDLVVFKRARSFITLAHFKLPGDGVLQKVFKRLFARRRFIFDDVVTR